MNERIEQGEGFAEMRCSVIIPTRDRSRHLPGCLAALSAQDHPDYEIVVVDDGSKDATESVARQFPSVRYLRQERLGQVAARNLGIGAASGDLLVFTDDDCRPPPDWLRRHESYYSEARVGAAGGPLVPVRPSFFDRFYMAHYRSEFTTVFRIERITGWERALTGNFSMRREIVARLGDFDRRFHSGSDADQMRRLVRAGWVFVQDHALGVAHEKRLGFVSFLRERFRKASGSLMTDVKEHSLHLRRFLPLLDPIATARVWRDYREMFGGGAGAGAAFWGLALLTRCAEVAGRAYYYCTMVLARGRKDPGD